MQATEADKAEEVFDVVLPGGDEAAEVVQPGEQPLDAPAAAVSAKLAPILCLAALAPVRGDHFDAVGLGQLPVEPVRVVGLVANQPRREFVEEAYGEKAAVDGARGT